MAIYLSCNSYGHIYWKPLHLDWHDWERELPIQNDLDLKPRLLHRISRCKHWYLVDAPLLEVPTVEINHPIHYMCYVIKSVRVAL